MRKNTQAMTLVEMMIAVSLVGLLAAFLVPAMKHASEQRENALVASHLRVAVNAFEMYRSEKGSYPPDKTPSVIPPEMVDYFRELDIYDDTDTDHDDEWWTQPTEVGGKWDWDNGYHFAYSVSISRPTVSVSQMEKLDELIDDGDLNTGTFRAVSGQYHYILEE